MMSYLKQNTCQETIPLNTENSSSNPSPLDAILVSLRKITSLRLDSVQFTVFLLVSWKIFKSIPSPFQSVTTLLEINVWQFLTSFKKKWVSTDHPHYSHRTSKGFTWSQGSIPMADRCKKYLKVPWLLWSVQCFCACFTMLYPARTSALCSSLSC